MPARINFEVLNVGQGSGNFIEIFMDEGDTVPTTTVLIDLGSEGASTSHHGPSLDRIVASLNKMAKPEIACLCLSHSDTDHISMILQLLAAFDPPGTVKPTKKILTINKTYYGGNSSLYSKRKGKNVLTEVKRYMPFYKPCSVTSNTSTYVDNIPLHEDKALLYKIHLLIGNTTKAEEDEIDDSLKLPETGDVNINTVSLVVVFDWNGVQFITTGDATGITMLRANAVLGSGPGSFLSDPLMLTVPHHGSYRTAYNFTGQGLRGNVEKTAALTLFARRCGAKILTASAGEVEKFKHPSAAILKIFWSFGTTQVPYSDPGAITDAHFYTAYYANSYAVQLKQPTVAATWPGAGKNAWYTLQTVVPVFTTDYFARNHLTAWEKPPPPPPKTGSSKPSPIKKTKVASTPYMAVLPTSIAAPSPGSVVEFPDVSKFPAEEVGWSIAMGTDLKYTMAPIVPTTASIAFLHALVANAERHYDWYASAEPRAPVRPTTLAGLLPLPRRPPERPGPSGRPRPKRR